MKLKYEFETVEIDNEIMAVPVGDNTENLHAMLRLNETAAAILALLKEETTEQKVIDAILSEYEGDPDEIAASVRDYLQTLRDNGVLEG